MLAMTITTKVKKVRSKFYNNISHCKSTGSLCLTSISLSMSSQVALKSVRILVWAASARPSSLSTKWWTEFKGRQLVSRQTRSGINLRDSRPLLSQYIMRGLWLIATLRWSILDRTVKLAQDQIVFWPTQMSSKVFSNEWLTILVNK